MIPFVKAKLLCVEKMNKLCLDKKDKKSGQARVCCYLPTTINHLEENSSDQQPLKGLKAP